MTFPEDQREQINTLLTSPVPQIVEPDAFEEYVRRIDTVREFATDDQTLALSGLRAAVGDVIGERLTERRRYFFELGELIGTNGYTTEVHYLLGESFFSNEANTASRQNELGAAFAEDPNAYLMAGYIIEDAFTKEVVDGSQTVDSYEGILETFQVQARAKSPQDYAAWLVKYLQAEEQVGQDVTTESALAAYTIDYDPTDMMYKKLVYLLGGRLSVPADLEYVYEVTQALAELSEQQAGLEGGILDLRVDLARISLTEVISKMRDGLSVGYAIRARSQDSMKKLLALGRTDGAGREITQVNANGALFRAWLS